MYRNIGKVNKSIHFSRVFSPLPREYSLKELKCLLKAKEGGNFLI